MKITSCRLLLKISRLTFRGSKRNGTVTVTGGGVCGKVTAQLFVQGSIGQEDVIDDDAQTDY